MANQAMDKQLDVTVKMLVTLITEPRMKAADIATLLDVSPNYIARMLARFREAGINIEYDYKKMQYVGKFEEQLGATILGPFAKKLKRAITTAEFSKPPIKFVTSLDRYTVAQFSEMLGVSPQNVYNGINGYKGQKLPTGWVAYQSTDGGNWMIVKARTDRSGKKYEVPPEIELNSHRYVLGAGDALKGKQKASHCKYPACQEATMSRGLCSVHYYQARRHPEKFEGIIEPK